MTSVWSVGYPSIFNGSLAVSGHRRTGRAVIRSAGTAWQLGRGRLSHKAPCLVPGPACALGVSAAVLAALCR
jgi:hypothetical protein